MKKITDMLKQMFVMMFGGLGRKACLKTQRFFAKARKAYTQMRNDAKTGDFAIEADDITPVRLFKQIQLALVKVILISATLLVQPFLRMCGLTLMDTKLNLLVKLALMAVLTALWIVALVTVSAQSIPDDADYKRFMKTLWRVFLGVSVALPTLDWQVACLFWRGEYIKATDALMIASFIASVGVVALIGLLSVAIVLCRMVWRISRFFVKKQPEASTVLAMIPEKDRKTDGEYLADE